MTCQERRLHKDSAEQDRLFNVWANEHSKRCPECGRVIEKSEGCNHMTCLCGAHFCWKCGKSFSAAAIYPHMDTAHGGMYDQAPVWTDPYNEGENIFVEQARLLAQLEGHRQQEIENNRVRQHNALQMIEHHRRQTQLEQEAIRRQNAQRAQMIEDRRRQFQLEQAEIRRRQLQNDEDEARRRREAARATPSTRDGNWCIVM